MRANSKPPIGADNPLVREIVDALAAWVLQRRSSRDYGSLIGEYEEDGQLYENAQQRVIVVEPSGPKAPSGHRERS